MAREIERKFLVVGTAWKASARGVRFRQGYLSRIEERTVRVRTEETRAVLTMKGLTTGVARLEFEYEIPLHDANRMLDELCERPLIEKSRYRVEAGGLIWEIDEFHGENDGLVLAEVGVRTHSRPSNNRDSACSKPCFSEPAMGWEPRNSTPSGSPRSNGRHRAALTLPASVRRVPFRATIAASRTPATIRSTGVQKTIRSDRAAAWPMCVVA